MTLTRSAGTPAAEQPLPLGLRDADDVVDPREDAHRHRHVGLGDRLERGEDRRRAERSDEPARHERNPGTLAPWAWTSGARSGAGAVPWSGRRGPRRPVERPRSARDSGRPPRAPGRRGTQARRRAPPRRRRRPGAASASGRCARPRRCPSLRWPGGPSRRSPCPGAGRVRAPALHRLGEAARPVQPGRRAASRKRASSIPLPTSVRRSSASPSPPRLRPARQVTAPR